MFMMSGTFVGFVWIGERGHIIALRSHGDPVYLDTLYPVSTSSIMDALAISFSRRDV